MHWLVKYQNLDRPISTIPAKVLSRPITNNCVYLDVEPLPLTPEQPVDLAEHQGEFCEDEDDDDEDYNPSQSQESLSSSSSLTQCSKNTEVSNFYNT